MPNIRRSRHKSDTLKGRGGVEYPARLQTALGALPEGIFSAKLALTTQKPEQAHAAIPVGLGEGSFFLASDKAIMQVEAGEALPEICDGNRPVRHGMPVRGGSAACARRCAGDRSGIQLRDARPAPREARYEAGTAKRVTCAKACAVSRRPFEDLKVAVGG